VKAEYKDNSPFPRG